MFATSSSKLIRIYGKTAEEAMRKALEQTVDEVGAVTAAEGIDCHFRKGGTVMLARNAAQLHRAREEVEEARSLGIGRGRPEVAERDPKLASSWERLRSSVRPTPRIAHRFIRLGSSAVWPRSSNDSAFASSKATAALELHRGTRRHAARHGPRRGDREGDGGLQRPAPRCAPGRDPVLLAHDRDRAASARTRSRRSACATGRPSMTSGTSSSTDNEPRDGRIAFGGRGRSLPLRLAHRTELRP